MALDRWKGSVCVVVDDRDDADAPVWRRDPGGHQDGVEATPDLVGPVVGRARGSPTERPGSPRW